MEEIKKIFERGDFVRYINKPNSFGIYEGIDLDPSMKYTKKYSLVLFFDPSKYGQHGDGGGWSSKPVMELPSDDKPCPKTIDTDKEDYSWRLCRPTEIEDAIKKMAEFNLEWDKETMSLIDTETGEIIHKVVVPKLEYKGNIIKPICEKFKKIIKKYVIKENKPNYGYGGYNGYAGHSPYYSQYDYEQEYWD